MKAKAYWSEKERVVSACLSDQIDDWQPLLTEEEWQAQHPLRLRKLGEGEALKRGRYYARVSNTPDKVIDMYRVMALEPLGQFSGYTYYELPDLTESEPKVVEVEAEWHGVVVEDTEPAPALTESVPTCEDGQLPDGPKCPKCGGNRAPSGINGGTWVHTAAPAPNAVGEQLTEPPEVGTWVVDFSSGRGVSIYRWCDHHEVYSGLYRWLAPIPTEPKEPEKVEPPQARGVVRQKVGDPTWRMVVYRATENDDPDGNEGPHLEGVSNFANGITWDGIDVCDALLITDDPAYPPSPELAALFAESEVGNG